MVLSIEHSYARGFRSQTGPYYPVKWILPLCQGRSSFEHPAGKGEAKTYLFRAFSSTYRVCSVPIFFTVALSASTPLSFAIAVEYSFSVAGSVAFPPDLTLRRFSC